MRNKTGQFVNGNSPINKKPKILKKCFLCGNDFHIVYSVEKVGKGIFCSKTCFNKSRIGRCRPIFVKTKISQGMLGDKNHYWKGNKVSYSGLHSWIRRMLGKATKCEHCGRNWDKPKSIGWANTDHKYKRNLTDWMSLCISCHGQYDRERGLRRH